MGSFVGYVRVSRVAGREGDSFQSPRQQEAQLNAWAAAHGHVLVDVVTELDVSGGRSVASRELERLVRSVEAGEADGIVVARLDRFARSLLHGLAAIERIERADGTFVAVQDGFDLSTPTGRLVLRIMLSLAEFEIDRIRGTFLASKVDAVRRGLAISSVAPFGYQRLKKGQPLEIDQGEAAFVVAIFERRGSGQGWATIARWLEHEGAITRYGSTRWANQALRRIVRNRVYLGEVCLVVDRSTGEQVVTRDAHPPIVPGELWTQANRITGPAFTPNPRNLTERSIVRGLLRCAGCRGSMRWEMRKFASGSEWLISCRNAAGGDTARSCPEPAYARSVEEIEQRIVAGVLAATEDTGGAASASVEDRGVEQVRERLRRAEIARDEWRDDSDIQAAVGMGQYVQGLRARQKAVEDAEQAALAVEVPARLRSAHDGLRGRWASLSDEQRVRVLEGLLLCVFVRRGKQGSGSPLDGRLRLIWRGEDVELPTRGRRVREVVGPFSWDDVLDADARVLVGQ